MKFGIRTPSLKKSFKAKTTRRVKRAVKSSVNPLYGKKSMGVINDPQKALYNKVYNKTTVKVVPSVFNNKDNDYSSKSANKSLIIKTIIIFIMAILILFLMLKCAINL